MKKYSSFTRAFSFTSAILSTFFFYTYTSAEVLELDSLKKIAQLIDKDTLVIFDIDNTLITTDQTLGSSEWYFYKYKQYLAKGMSTHKAYIKAQAEWKQINDFTTVSPVEPETVEFFHNLQRKNIPTLGLTARPDDVVEMTEKQLKSQNMDFSKTPLIPKKKQQITRNSHYTRGIIFVDEQNKGEILLKFFKKAHFSPKKVVFIDDVTRNAVQVNAALTAKGIDTKSVRYSATDTQVNAFDSKIADMQMRVFINKRELISNDTAKKMLTAATN